MGIIQRSEEMRLQEHDCRIILAHDSGLTMFSSSNLWRKEKTERDCLGSQRSLMVCILLPPETKLRQGNVFTPVCDSVHRGVSVPACTTDHMTRGLCPGVSVQGSLSRMGSLSSPGWVSVQSKVGSLSRGVSVQGFSVQGCLCPGGLCPGGTLSRVCLCQGGSLLGRPLWI